MPFKEENGQVIWVEPTKADKVAFKKSLTKESGVVPLTHELKARVDEALRSVNPQNNYTKLINSNNSVYNTIKKLVQTPPGLVDIILPVHNSIHITRKCIKAVLERTHWPYHLYIVDDCSDQFTKNSLVEIVKEHSSKITVITNVKNRGFAASVNRGIKVGNGKYVCLLNSDVLVTDLWLTKMIMALKADDRNQIVCPATNNTAIVEIPLSPGASYIQTNKIFESFTTRRYPEILPTGFCFLFRRNLIDKIGYFDEAYKNFGEEALALDTPILTIKGWSTVGDLVEGDQVFSLDGFPTEVIKTTEIFENRDCYKFTFDNGESITADSGHNWLVSIKNNKIVQRSGEIFNRFTKGEKIYVPIGHPIQLLQGERNLPGLPIDPYVLGAWLGDGSSSRPSIFTTDFEILENIRKAGWEIKKVPSGSIEYSIKPSKILPLMNRGYKGQFTKSTGNSFKAKLHTLNLINNKHIPFIYLCNTISKRWALLQGLMDTDGYCSPTGRCVFSTSNYRLLQDFLFLVRSLGLKASVTENKKNIGKINWKVTFRGRTGVFCPNPFRLSRKASRYRSSLHKTSEYYRIVKIEKINSVPVKCIAVADSSHVFRAGKSLIPTHNTDLWWRTIRYADGSNYTRYKAVLADDTYVFHERGASYSQLGNETHMFFRKLASSRFNDLWPEWAEWKKSYDVKKALGNLKDKIPPVFLRDNKDKYRICWVVQSAEMCGGMAFIKDIVNELTERGICAKIAVIKASPEARESYLPELTSAPVFFNTAEDFIHGFKTNVFPSGIVVASTSSITPVVSTLCELSEGQLRPMLHTQSYEIDMVDYLKAPEEQEAVKEQFKAAFKKIPNVLSSSKWITKELESFGVKPFATVVPGVDVNLFYPRNRSKGDDRPTVMLPIVSGNRSQNFIPGFDKVKGYERGLLLIQELERIAEERGIELRILVYGAKSLPTVSNAICLGPLPQTRLATLLGTEVDIFIDPASLHSYGMPALEALASGLKVFSWDNKGINEYANEVMSVDVFRKDDHPTILAEAIIEYLENKEKPLVKLANRTAIENNHNRDLKVKEVIESIEKHFNLHFSSKNISILVPHLRKHGGPTTMLAIGNELAKLGHKVSIRTYYQDIKDEVVSMTDLPISFDCRNLGKTDLIITNSDHPLTEAIANAKNVKKIMLKLSHNARFKTEEERGLQQNWDAIVTSSEWLKNVCENPTKGWNYPKKTNVHRIGWWNYAFDMFQCHPTKRTYGGETIPFTIATLIHGHEMKGTKEAIQVLGSVFLKLRNKVRFVGIGEAPPKSFDSDLPNFHYVYSPSREELATVLKQTDIWLGASRTEGLGRMGLEAMSAGCAVVLSNTGAEYAQDEENCLLYPIGDLAAAERAVIRILSDKELAFKLRESAYRTAAAAANPAPCMEVLQKVIENVL